MPGVASMSEYRRATSPKRTGEMKRLAMQLALQLPEDPSEAAEVVEHMQTLVRAFMGDPKPV